MVLLIGVDGDILVLLLPVRVIPCLKCTNHGCQHQSILFCDE